MNNGNRRWQDNAQHTIKASAQNSLQHSRQSVLAISQCLSPIFVGKWLFVLLILSVLMFTSMIMAHAQSQQCFSDPQQAYAYLVAQQQQQRLQAEQVKNNKVININQAGEAQLTELSGIGSQKAQQIILYREAFGAFTTIDELVKVRGIGAQTVAKNRNRMVVQ